MEENSYIYKGKQKRCNTQLTHFIYFPIYLNLSRICASNIKLTILLVLRIIVSDYSVFFFSGNIANLN